ncbi:hypothetical protein [Desulfobulbus elongatus]|uniref:hypothetical protein n=1 Tax=Desulfobulbus elongatus TaxID=53332 RepID=UPI00047F40D5|nr:hypothetical protein [Desulfobulbus elongatus]
MVKGLKGLGRRDDRAEAVKKLRAVKICPVTNGRPTSMTLEGFQTACERCRKQDRHEWSERRPYKYTWCDECRGKQRPDELRIVNLAAMIAAREMKKMVGERLPPLSDRS